MIFTPVGVRCRRCAAHKKSALRRITPRQYLRGLGSGLGAAFIAGLLVGQLQLILPFTFLFLYLATGWAVGEAVSWGAYRQRGTGLMVVAGLCAFLAYLIAGSVSIAGRLGFIFLIGNPFIGLMTFSLLGWIFVAIGIGLAVYRLKE
jgi:hypothetical protein